MSDNFGPKIGIADQVYQDLLKRMMANTPLDEVDERVAELEAAVADIVDGFALEGSRHAHAQNLIDVMMPVMVDVRLWQDLALGRNLELPATDQYGPIDARLKPTKDPKGDPNGRVHSKGDQAPSAFIRRQGLFLSGNAQRIAKAEQEIAKAQQHLKELNEERVQVEHGLHLYAAAMLMAAIRKAMTPVFAMGPAWTVLRAIQDPTGREASPLDQEKETARILVSLHALRDHTAFRSALKRAILQVCHDYGGEAERASKDSFAGPYDYQEVLRNHGFSQRDAYGDLELGLV